jgi:serum/glucocorticoid-regulated kinase 2
VLSELSILKQLHHPFLVHLHFSFQTPYYLYLALDYCGRGDLSRYMTRGVILEELTAKFIIAEIILAIEYLHEKNIIYRDLKPENVILDDEGYIKLIDFGLSKEGIEADFIAKSFCGSPAYLSPELISGSGTTKATDIYSIGTILFEMLTGYPPFFTTSLKQLLNNIRYRNRQPLIV